MVRPGYKWNLLPYAPSITCPTNLFIHAKFCDVSSLQAHVAHFGRRAFGLLFVVEFGLEDTKVKAFRQWLRLYTKQRPVVNLDNFLCHPKQVRAGSWT